MSKSATSGAIDLDGHMWRCIDRLIMMGQSLEALAHSDLAEVKDETLSAFGGLALELAAELQDIDADVRLRVG